MNDGTAARGAGLLPCSSVEPEASGDRPVEPLERRNTATRTGRVKRLVGRFKGSKTPHRSGEYDAVIATALGDARRRGLEKICIFVSWRLSASALSRLLADARISGVGLQDCFTDILGAVGHQDEDRIGRYWIHGGLLLPAETQHIYFIAPWSHFSREMLRELVRHNVRSIRFPLATGWCGIPLRAIQMSWQRVRKLPLPVKLFLNDLTMHGRVAPFWRARQFTLEGAIDRLVEAPCSRLDFVPKRVVLVSSSLAPGGTERQITHLLSGLVDAGPESVHLLCHNLTKGEEQYDFYLPQVRALRISVREISRGAPLNSSDAWATAFYPALASLPTGLATDIVNLAREFNALKPEVVHAWLDWDNVRAGLAAVIAGVPCVIISGRNVNPTHFHFYNTYMDPSYRALVRTPNVRIINNSRAGGDDYARWIGISPNDIKVVHNAVDFGERSRLSPDEVARQKTALGIPADAFVAGGMFRFAAEKRPHLWLETAAIVARTRADVHFVVFGQGPLHGKMRRYASRLGIGDRLIMPGVTKDPLEALSIMNLFMLTSSSEGLPNVLIEAQWVGTPVLTTDAGGAREAVDQGVTGWFMPTAEPAELAAAILRAMDDAEWRARAAIAGPKFVRENFGLTRMVNATLDLYAVGRGVDQSKSRAVPPGSHEPTVRPE
jgi:glycosyltransferase involved in cell wall biosynthesis